MASGGYGRSLKLAVVLPCSVGTGGGSWPNLEASPWRSDRSLVGRL